MPLLPYLNPLLALQGIFFLSIPFCQASHLFLKQSQIAPETDLTVFDQEGYEVGHTHFNRLTQSYLFYNQTNNTRSYASPKKQEFDQQSLFFFEEEVYLGQLESQLDPEKPTFIFRDSNDQDLYRADRSKDDSRVLSFWSLKTPQEEPAAVLTQTFNDQSRGANLEYDLITSPSQIFDERLAIFCAAKEAHILSNRAFSRKRIRRIKTLTIPSLMILTSGILFYQSLTPKSESQELLKAQDEVDRLKQETKRIQDENTDLFLTHTHEKLGLAESIQDLTMNHTKLNLRLKDSQELTEIHLKLFQDLPDETRASLISRKAEIQGKTKTEVTSDWENLKPKQEINQLNSKLINLTYDRDFFRGKREKAQTQLKARASFIQSLEKKVFLGDQAQRMLTKNEKILTGVRTGYTHQRNLSTQLKKEIGLKEQKMDTLHRKNLSQLRSILNQARTLKALNQDVTSLFKTILQKDKKIAALDQSIQVKNKKLFSLLKISQAQTQTIHTKDQNYLNLNQTIQLYKKAMSDQSDMIDDQDDRIKKLDQEYRESADQVHSLSIENDKKNRKSLESLRKELLLTETLRITQERLEHATRGKQRSDNDLKKIFERLDQKS